MEAAVEKSFEDQLQPFKGETLVLKYGGSFMDAKTADARDEVARDILTLHLAGVLPVVVHGGGKAITAALDQAGIPHVFEEGYRVTTAAAVDIVDRVLTREISPAITATLNRIAGTFIAECVPGPSIFKAEKFFATRRSGEQVDLQFVGDVAEVDADKIREVIGRGKIPVISPTAIGPGGGIYNCNADVAAAKVAGALKADRLVFMTDTPGVLTDLKDPMSRLPILMNDAVDELKDAGIIDKGMIPKVASGIEALESGVGHVRIVDGREPHSMFLHLLGKVKSGTEVLLRDTALAGATFK